jgi:hypothetical protein
METSLVSIEAEATYRVDKAERDADNQIKATQDELRRVQKEVDAKGHTIAKMKKRKLSSTTAMNSAPNPTVHSGTITITTPDTNNMQLQPLQSMGIVSTRQFSPNQKAPKSNTNTKKKGKTTIYENRVAIHLLRHFDLSSRYLSTVFSTDENNHNREQKCQLDGLKIRNLLHLLIFERSEAIPTNNLIAIDSDEVHHQNANILTIAKELMCIIVKRSRDARVLLETENRNKVSNDHIKHLILILSILQELCSINHQTRSCIRKWIIFEQDQHLPINGNYHTIAMTSSRIRGLPKKHISNIQDVSIHIRNNMIFKGGSQFKWNERQRSYVCKYFMSSISFFLVGIELSSVGNSDMSKLQSLMIQCASFLMVLLHDVDVEGSDGSSNMIWIEIFDNLFPQHNVDSGRHWHCLSLVFGRNNDFNRENYLHERLESQSSTDSLEYLTTLLPVRVMIMKLLHQIILSSAQVRNALFERKMCLHNPVYREDVSFVRVFYASALDLLQLSLLPTMKHKQKETDPQDLIHVQSFTFYIIRTLTVLCATNPGLTLIRTEMKVGDDMTSDSGVAVIGDVLDYSVLSLLHETKLDKKVLNQIVNSCIAFFFQMMGQGMNRKKEGKLFVSILHDSDKLASIRTSCKMITNLFPINSNIDSSIGEMTKKRAKLILQIIE